MSMSLAHASSGAIRHTSTVSVSGAGETTLETMHLAWNGNRSLFSGRNTYLWLVFRSVSVHDGLVVTGRAESVLPDRVLSLGFAMASGGLNLYG